MIAAEDADAAVRLDALFLLQRRAGRDPHTRGVLEAAATGDLDVQVRETAAALLGARP